MKKLMAVTAALLAVFALTLSATPTFADTSATKVDSIGTKAKVVTAEAQKGLDVLVHGKKVPTSLQKLRLPNGKFVPSYCADYSFSLKIDVAMVESSWADYPGLAAKGSIQFSKVNWIVQHSYPTVTSLLGLQKVLNVKLISEKVAIAATQLAVWHYTDKVQPDASNDAVVLALYQYLINGAELHQLLEPLSALSLIPAGTTTGKAGDKIGPFLVKTKASLAILTLTGASGVQLVDVSGKQIKKVTDGTKVWVKVGAAVHAGSATIHANIALGVIGAGRMFRGDGVKAQTLISAAPVQAPILVTVGVSWGGSGGKGDGGSTPPSGTPASHTPSASPSSTQVGNASGNLPLTGTNVALFGAAGAILLLLGGGLFFFARKKRTA
jgi:TQXA domain-containing protein/LPXTG-motif cell wall-anchored protein